MTRGVLPEVLARISIVDLWANLGGGALRRGRGRAFWRSGDGYNIALDAERNVWFDHARGEGGGALALIEVARGCSRADAVRWLATFAGVDLPEMTESDRRWLEQQARDRADLPAARAWRRASIDLMDDLLATLKAALFDPLLPEPRPGEIRGLEDWRRSLYQAGPSILLADFRRFGREYPKMADALVRAGRRAEAAEQRALARFIVDLSREAS